MTDMLMMFWLELKMRFKGIASWSVIWLALGSLLIGLFDTFSIQQEDYEKLIKSLPKGISSSFNIQDNYLSSVESFLSGQFMTFYTLIGTIFACFFGVYLVVGKIEDRTMFQLLTKSVSRTKLYIVLLFEGFTFFAISSVFLGGLLYFFANVLTKQENISGAFFANLFFGTLILNIFFLLFALVLGMFVGRSQGLAIGGGLAGFTWFVNTLSKIKGFPEWMQYTSPFYYFNITELTKNFNLDYQRISLLLVSIAFMTIFGLWKFRKMDIAL